LGLAIGGGFPLHEVMPNAIAQMPEGWLLAQGNSLGLNQIH
jgi:hypothetical protein